MPEDGCNVDLLALMKTLPCKNKEEGGSARAWPVAAPMPKSDHFSEKKECLDGSVLAFCFRVPFTVGGLCIYNVYCSQFEGCKDSPLLDEIFLDLYRMRY